MERGDLQIFSRPKPIENSGPSLQSLGASVLLAVNICFICSFSFYYHLLLLLLLLFFICLLVGVISAGCRTVAILLKLFCPTASC